MTKELTVGLHRGDAKMAFVFADRLGETHYRTTLPTILAAELSEAICPIARQLNALIARFEPVRGIGIAVPDPVDSDRGVAIRAVILGWNNVPIRDLIAERLTPALPVYLANNVNVGALGASALNWRHLERSEET